MPTYEYACTACGSEWEESQRITAPPLEVCPKCGKASAHRLISAGGGFILKGGGWYSDLYSSAKPPASKAESSDGASSDAGAAKADAPAASSDAAPKKEAVAKTETKTAASTPTPTSSTPASST